MPGRIHWVCLVSEEWAPSQLWDLGCLQRETPAEFLPSAETGCGSAPQLHASGGRRAQTVQTYIPGAQAELFLSSDALPQGLCPGWGSGPGRGTAMAGAQEGNAEPEGAGEAAEGLCVCSCSPGTERGHLAS